ncbi:13938_t:CDS:1, partial [Ambispora leptoticha]
NNTITCSADSSEYQRDPNNCTRFYQCSNGTPYLFDCPSGTAFNTDIS